MKKRWCRMVAAVMTCVLLCTMLSGCSVIDNLRASTATQVDADTLSWNGATYKRLDENLSSKAWLYDVDYNRSVYINTDNIPILLMPFLCTEYNPTGNDVFLRYYTYNGFSSMEYVDGYEMSYYCREDRYDEVVRQLLEGLELTVYQYEYFDYDDNEIHTYYFTEEERAAFLDVVSPMNRWNGMLYGSDWTTTVYACTEDGLHGPMYEILQDDGAYYVAYYPQEDYYADYDVYDEYTEDYVTEYYRVPREYYELFRKILADSMREQTEWNSRMNEWDEL